MQKIPLIYLIQSGMVRMESSFGEEFALHADICYLGSDFLATDYIMSFLQSPGTQSETDLVIYNYRSRV